MDSAFDKAQEKRPASESTLVEGPICGIIRHTVVASFGWNNPKDASAFEYDAFATVRTRHANPQVCL
jgi:hypothetical protein